MDQLTNLIKKEIKKQYKSVRQFTSVLDIPYTTVASALKNGINGTAYETVTKMCEALNIRIVNYQHPLLINDEVITVLNMYNALDEKGAHAVRTVMEMEYLRCIGQEGGSGSVFDNFAEIGAQNGTTIVEAEDQISVSELLHEIADED